jgi:hypothetical protein
MRSCRHCAHENADHLAFCSQCGHKLPRTDVSLGSIRPLGVVGDADAAFTRTVLATPFPVSTTGRATVAGGLSPSGRLVGRGAPPAPPVPRSRLRWLGESVGYIYVYLRSKLDAGERRRRLSEERAGAEVLLTGALNELGQTVMREGVQHPELTGLLEAIGRAHARREAAAADTATSESLQQAQAARLGAQQTAAEAEWTAADNAAREAEQILRDTNADRRSTAARMARVQDERERLDRSTTESGPIGDARSAQIAHDAAALANEQRALDEQAKRLDEQLADLRDKVARLRAAGTMAKGKLDQIVAERRLSSSSMAASIAGRQRDRADAEREISDLTAQIGRVAVDIRPPHAVLLSGYQNIDRLNETIADRTAQLAAIEQARGHYDHRKLAAGVGVLTCMLFAVGAALWWAVLR